MRVIRPTERLPALFAGILLVIVMYVHYNGTKSSVSNGSKYSNKEAEIIETKHNTSKSSEEPVFMMVVCRGSNINEGSIKNYMNQLRQAEVLLKSAAILTKISLRFIVIADSKKIYEDLIRTYQFWPSEYQHRLSLEYHPVWYPADRIDIISMYRTCSTQRLFLPTMFPQIDATVYVDTDTIFMRPPEDLWKEFKGFGPDHVMGISPEAYWYSSNENKMAYYGKNGLNSGLLLMNLTRLRNFPGEDWTAATMNVFDQFKQDIKLGDQDILNTLFNKRPTLVLELGCEWNYQSTYLKKGRRPCSTHGQDEHKGVSLLHGNFRTFIESPEDFNVKAVFRAFEDHNIEDPLEKLLDKIKGSLKDLENTKVSPKDSESEDSYIDDIDDVLIKEFIKHV